MTREAKIAIGILIVGALGVGGYWYWPANAKSAPEKIVKHIRERIILPQYDPRVYQQVALVQEYFQDLQAMIDRGEAVLPLPESALNAAGRKAQVLLLKSSKFLRDTRNGDKLMHNDMMRILPAPIASLDEKSKKICASHACYQAEKYNFVTNATTRAIVDVEASKVLSVDYFPGMQPDISHRLKKIAEAIALNAPEVKKELGHIPARNDITMANVRGSMKESPCENTNHLCVAPTFADHQNERALWAVVDLTQMRLAAAKWAGLGKTTTPACISERSLENRYIMENFCQKDTVLDRDGWHITYRLTASDGLEVRDVTYRGHSVLHSAKIVDWHVSYQQEGGDKLDTSTETFIEGRRVEFVRGEDGKYMFGYNDAMGCPMFSTSVVLAFNGPQVRDLPKADGFMLTQDFRNPKWPMACNYRYENRFEFYKDGSFRVVAVNKGRGCGDNAVYRPVMRIDLAVGEKEVLYSRQAGDWKRWDKEESEHVGLTSGDPKSDYPYKLTLSTDASKGYYLEPNHGQFGDNSRGDNANLFVTHFKEDEGNRDMLTLGSCCQLDSDGPERFTDKEPIDGDRIVLWYVPRIRNDAREGHEYCWADTRIGENGNPEIKVWPCTVGPKFVPISSN